MVLGIMYMGGYLLTSNQLTAGQLMAYLMATQTIQRSLAQLSLLFGSVVRGISAGTRVFEVRCGVSLFERIYFLFFAVHQVRTCVAA